MVEHWRSSMYAATRLAYCVYLRLFCKRRLFGGVVGKSRHEDAGQAGGKIEPRRTYKRNHRQCTVAENDVSNRQVGPQNLTG